MKYVIVIPASLEQVLKQHLFQNELEQGAFLHSRVIRNEAELVTEAVDYYAVPPSGWEIQSRHYLEMRDSERAKIMKTAREGGFSIIECHSHPHSGSRVFFSPSDCIGITQFAAYAKWKLDARPYAAMVWGESSVDAVIWHGDFAKPNLVHEVRFSGSQVRTLKPRNTWMEKTSLHWLEGLDAN